MPGLLTEITEIVTGLGMTGIETLAEALAARPASVQNVTEDHWARLDHALSKGLHAEAFGAAWENGRAFLESQDGLRGRVPLLIEWKGAHQPSGFDFLPADLRVDHVFLVSCKYQSRILANSSPSNLFVRRLADRTAGPDPASWYETCAPDAYQHLYSCIRRHVGQPLLPVTPEKLTGAQLNRIREACGGAWPTSLAPIWSEFSLVVAEASAAAWRRQLQGRARRTEMLWRLLRLNPASYFVLGSLPGGSMRLRIGTPWDWRQLFALDELQISAVPAGQPKVSWFAELTERKSGASRIVAGHVEVRWAHGRFSTVEAKVYLDTPHTEVPGYFPLPAP